MMHEQSCQTLLCPAVATAVSNSAYKHNGIDTVQVSLRIDTGSITTTNNNLIMTLPFAVGAMSLGGGLSNEGVNPVAEGSVAASPGGTTATLRLAAGGSDVANAAYFLNFTYRTALSAAA